MLPESLSFMADAIDIIFDGGTGVFNVAMSNPWILIPTFLALTVLIISIARNLLTAWGFEVGKEVNRLGIKQVKRESKNRKNSRKSWSGKAKPFTTFDWSTFTFTKDPPMGYNDYWHPDISLPAPPDKSLGDGRFLPPGESD